MRIAATAVVLCSWFGISVASADDLKDYGEYLAGECTTCHRIDGAESEIPSITGWDTDTFTETLGYYKSGLRKNPAMESVAKSLDDEQVKALAAYFGSIKVDD